MIKPFVFGACLAVCLPPQSLAESIPKKSQFDRRVRNVIYNPDDVIRVRVAPGAATLIQLHPSEYINEVEGGLGLGDSEAWAVNVKGNNIWIKPTDKEPDTNLTIVTNKRTYFFSLVSVARRNDAYWAVRFHYPDVKKKNNNIDVLSRPCQGYALNYRYFVKGAEKKITPNAVWDNGVFTCFRFPVGGDLPLIFKKLPDGKEGLVNYHVENDYVVVHEINDEYRIRLGDIVVGVKTDHLQAKPVLNSTTNGKAREVIDE